MRGPSPRHELQPSRAHGIVFPPQHVERIRAAMRIEGRGRSRGPTTMHVLVPDGDLAERTAWEDMTRVRLVRRLEIRLGDCQMYEISRVAALCCLRGRERILHSMDDRMGRAWVRGEEPRWRDD